MVTITVRSIGMSVALEGFGPAGLAPSRLLAVLSRDHGEAVAAVGEPVEIILIDRSVLDWDDTLAMVEDWMARLGHRPGDWTHAGCRGGREARMVLTREAPPAS